MQNTIISYDLTIYQPSMYKKWDALNQCLRGWVEKCNRTTYPGSDVQNISISTSLKESFRFIYTAMKIDFFRIEIPNTMSSNGGYFEINIKDCIEDLALSQRSTLYYKNEFLLSYCQLLESVVDFVDVAQLECLDKERYIAVVRFQLTKDELAIIFYNALLYGPDGKNGLKLPKLKLLLEKYRLLRDVTENVLLDPSHIHLYREKPEAATP
ncbi:hypothetical protein MishRS11D_13080 [Methylomagnum ishizawai]|nr:hypothetical protein MishRS11D_13080 [Methylomagnum ishizawai]